MGIFQSDRRQRLRTAKASRSRCLSRIDRARSRIDRARVRMGERAGLLASEMQRIQLRMGEHERGYGGPDGVAHSLEPGVRCDSILSIFLCVVPCITESGPIPAGTRALTHVALPIATNSHSAVVPTGIKNK